MGVNPIAVNLKRIRTIKGLNQEWIAKKSGLSRMAYSNIEKGKAEPRVSNLQKIADVLGVGIQEIIAPIPHINSLRFRSKNTLTNKEKNRREQIAIDVAFWLQDFNELEASLNNKKIFKLKELSQKTKDPKKMAVLAREALNLESDEPIVDLCGLLESKAGIKIKFFNSDLDKFNGLSLFDSDETPAIGVNVSELISVERQIFTLAHELAHLLLRKNSYKSDEVNEPDKQEKEADVFASYFLMPEDAFLKSWEENKGLHWIDNVLHTKRIYKVSYMTVLLRLEDLKWIDNSIIRFRSAYKIKFGRDLKNKREPNPLDRVDFFEDRLSHLVREAYESEKITFSRASEVLKVDAEVMRDRVNSWELVKR